MNAAQLKQRPEPVAGDLILITCFDGHVLEKPQCGYVERVNTNHEFPSSHWMKVCVDGKTLCVILNDVPIDGQVDSICDQWQFV